MKLRRKCPSLNRWIEEFGGPIAVAEKLGVDHSTVRHWRRGCNLPSDRLLFKIIKLSKGAVTLEEIFAIKQKKA